MLEWKYILVPWMPLLYSFKLSADGSIRGTFLPLLVYWTENARGLWKDFSLIAEPSLPYSRAAHAISSSLCGVRDVISLSWEVPSAMLIISTSSIHELFKQWSYLGSSSYSGKTFECRSVSAHSCFDADCSKTVNWPLLRHMDVIQIFLPQVFYFV